MKKLMLICLVLLMACSSTDNDKSISIVGTWKPIAEVDICSTGSIDTYNLNTCSQTTRFVFNSDGTYTFEEYSDSKGSRPCEIDFEESGLWVIKSNKITLTSNSETSTPSFFELEANVFRVGYYDADPNDPCDGGNLPSHYYIEYVRL